ncbi:hypothetical protein ACFLVP_02145 [Chloroflexota bacterium]
MRRYKNAYSYLAVLLLVCGAAFCTLFYFAIYSVPLIAVGSSMLILGFVCLALFRSLPNISPETGKLLLEAGMENINALIEELGLRTKAIYLPSSRTGSGRPQALLPISPKVDIEDLNRKLPQRLIVKFGEGDESVGLLVSTPGSVSFDLLTSEGADGAEGIEYDLKSVLVGVLDAVSDVSVEQRNDMEFDVKLSGLRLNHSNTLVYQWLGTPVASVVASILSESLDRPVTIIEEKQNKRHVTIRLGVL